MEEGGAVRCTLREGGAVGTPKAEGVVRTPKVSRLGGARSDQRHLGHDLGSIHRASNSIFYALCRNDTISCVIVLCNFCYNVI